MMSISWKKARFAVKTAIEISAADPA